MQKVKLKKKWKFWRAFKYFVLRKKNIRVFFKMKWLFNNQAIIFKGLTNFYGVNFKKNIWNFRNKLNKNKFFIFLSLLELRLSVLFCRLGWIKNIKHAKILTLSKVVSINGVFIKSSNYILCVGDILKKLELLRSVKKNIYIKKRFFKVQIKTNVKFKYSNKVKAINVIQLNYSSKLKRRKFKLKWKRYQWCKWFGLQVKKRNWVTTPWLLSKICICINFLERHASQGVLIVIKRPLIGDLLIQKNSFYFFKNSSLLKKIYSVY